MCTSFDTIILLIELIWFIELWKKDKKKLPTSGHYQNVAMWKFNLIPKRGVEKDYHIVLLMTINYLIKGDQNLRKLKWIHEVF